MKMDIKDLILDEKYSQMIFEDGVWILADNKLNSFLNSFAALPVVEAAIRKEDYLMLPFLKKKHTDFEWRFRQQSLKIVNELLKDRKRQLILEIGSWNGWLSNRLSQSGHQVVALDYFIDEKNGLRAKKNYKTEWTSIQLDLNHPSIFKIKFDVIIVNHCLQFFLHPACYVRDLKNLLNPGGIIILLGMSFYKDPKTKKSQVNIFKNYFKENHNMDIFYQPTKGFLNQVDKMELKAENVIFKAYSGKWLRNLCSTFIATKPLYKYGYLVMPRF